MQVRTDFPPNYQQIKSVINPPEDAVFPWGSVLYNPSGKEIPADIIFHEEIHGKQQRNYIDPSFWWTKWLYDKDFRKSQELEAFAKQCKFVKDNLGTKAFKECLEECAENLSNNYKLGINKFEAATLIRRYGK